MLLKDLKEMVDLFPNPTIAVTKDVVIAWNQALDILVSSPTLTPAILHTKFHKYLYLKSNALEELNGTMYKPLIIRKTIEGENVSIITFTQPYGSTLNEDFIVALSHELKTPLMKIKSILDVIDMDSKYQEISNRSILQLEDSIRKLLEVSLISWEDLKEETINIENIRKELHSKYKDSKENISFFVKNETTKEHKVIGGDFIILRALDILIDNSFTWTKSGRIQIILKSIKGKLQIEVEDTGSGIKRENINKVFEPFFTENKERTGQRKGLGLAILKNLLTKVGGRAFLNSEVNVGTQIVLTF